MNFNITICNIDEDLKTVFDEHLSKYNNMSYYNGDFRDLPDSFDCIVSPGNSFGLMDGGVDGIIKSYFKAIDICIVVQTKLLEEVGGIHQPGSCILVNTTNDNNSCKYLAHCPTMIIPMKIKDYSVIYWCIWHLLVSVHKHNKINEFNQIKHILCPCLGTGVGKVKYEYFIKLFKLALENFNDYIKLIATDYTNIDNYCILGWGHAMETYDKLTGLISTFEEKKDDIYDTINKRRGNQYW